MIGSCHNHHQHHQQHKLATLDTNSTAAKNTEIAARTTPPIFEEYVIDDYVNPHAVHNCLSPFVSTSAERIEAAMLAWVRLEPDDVFLDIGCGDDRFCFESAAKLKVSVGLLESTCRHSAMKWLGKSRRKECVLKANAPSGCNNGSS